MAEWLEWDSSLYQRLPERLRREQRWLRPGELVTIQRQTRSQVEFALDDLERLRDFHRQRLRLAEAGMISLDWVSLDRRPALRLIGKYPAQGHFFGRLEIRGAREVQTISVTCFPEGVTGERECVALIVAEKKGLVKPRTFEGFFQDRYAPELREGPYVCSLADAEEWDTHFPEHPLSRVRARLQHWLETLRIPEETRAGQPHQPNSAEAYLSRSQALAGAGLYKLALTDCREAILLAPGRAYLHAYLAQLLMKLECHQSAELALITAIEIAPRVSAYHELLGRCLTLQDREEPAAACCAEAERLRPSLGR